MAKVTSVVDTIMAEAGGKTPAERFQDMKAIASVIHNRAVQTGVPLKDVVRVQSQFNAYGRAFPAGVEKYRALAERALREVQESGPIHNATYYATPRAAGNLPGGLEAETTTAGHHYFSDPQNRAIRTAQGYVEPSGSVTLASYAPEARAAVGSSPFDSLSGGYSATPQQALAGALSREGEIAGAAASGGLLSSAREGYGSPFGALGDRITSEYGNRAAPRTPFGVGSSFHAGLDMSLGPGASGYPVEAAAGGVVSYAGPRQGYGNMVEITHPDGMRTRYGHLAEIGNVAIGDEVARGTPVGVVGNTGRSAGPHLHFETIDQEGRKVDPRSVVGFDTSARVPTPEARPEAWNSAAPMAVERRSLPDAGAASLDQQKRGYGLLADTMRQTPSLNLSGAGVNTGVQSRMMDNAEVAQGRDGLRSALTADNAARAPATLALSDRQRQDALARRDAAKGVLAGAQTVSSPLDSGFSQAVERSSSVSPKTSRLTPAVATPESYPSNVKAAVSLTGVSPTLTSTVPVSAVSSPLRDISAPLNETEYTGIVGPNPALTAANQFGVAPVKVQTITPGLLASPVETAAMVEGPATAKTISSPQTTTRRTTRQVGLLSPDEYGMVADQQMRTAAQGVNRKAQLASAFKNGIGPLGGGILGGLVAGPLGALLGGYLGNQLMNTVTTANGFPAAPKGPVYGDGKQTDYGRSVAQSSGQYRSAVSKGSVGLY
ncbi:peptidoglycan DD-metalloendopeptidase family protein [Shinella zoogloeoides]|uniref:peptidoglycan DD-metalloendopeptidase family protein n=1 Tax=Shinella zoogloeoides TaxID=352475 RepID=UPI0028A8F49C|nr:peptidoglycan DD-metalloendopeptidase family protein [Shinella zoogloeoides]